MRSLSLRIVPLVARCAQILGPPGLASASASQNVVQNLPALLLNRILPKAQLGGLLFQCDATTNGGGGPGLGRRRRRRTQSQIRNKGFDLPLQGLWSDLGGTLTKKGTRSGNELRGRESSERSADRTFRADSATALVCQNFPQALERLGLPVPGLHTPALQIQGLVAVHQSRLAVELGALLPAQTALNTPFQVTRDVILGFRG